MSKPASAVDMDPGSLPGVTALVGPARYNFVGFGASP